MAFTNKKINKDGLLTKDNLVTALKTVQVDGKTYKLVPATIVTVNPETHQQEEFGALIFQGEKQNNPEPQAER